MYRYLAVLVRDERIICNFISYHLGGRDKLELVQLFLQLSTSMTHLLHHIHCAALCFQSLHTALPTPFYVTTFYVTTMLRT